MLIDALGASIPVTALLIAGEIASAKSDAANYAAVPITRAKPGPNTARFPPL
jgi:hypothetical protein